MSFKEPLNGDEIITKKPGACSRNKIILISIISVVILASVVTIVAISNRTSNSQVIPENKEKPKQEEEEKQDVPPYDINQYTFPGTRFNWKNYIWTPIHRNTTTSKPGPNYYLRENILVPKTENIPLIMRITNEDHTAFCSEFCFSSRNPVPLGYGTYQIDLSQKVEDIANTDENCVFGFFLYKNDSCEIDIEIAKWGSTKENAKNMDYVSQPHTEGVTGLTFQLPYGHQNTRHSFTWEPKIIKWSAVDLDTGEEFFKWNTTENLRDEKSEMQLSFIYWMMKGYEPKVKEQIIKIEDFKYINYTGIRN